VKGRGRAAMTVTAALSPKGNGTRVDVAQDLQLSGAAAQYGRGMVADFSAIMMRDFGANMADRITRLQRGESAEQIAAASAGSSVGGFTLAMRAAQLALTRVFRRFFLPYQPAALPARDLTRKETPANGALVDRQRDLAGRRAAGRHLPAQPRACGLRADPGRIR